jgi:two-component system invasion response regulator UvrY
VADVLRRDGGGLVHDQLSPRELEIFCLIAKGKEIKQIAFMLSVSPKTVSTHIARIKEKTSLESYVDFARYALQNKLVE